MAQPKSYQAANSSGDSATVREHVERMDKSGKAIARKSASASEKLHQAAREMRKGKAA